MFEPLKAGLESSCLAQAGMHLQAAVELRHLDARQLVPERIRPATVQQGCSRRMDGWIQFRTAYTNGELLLSPRGEHLRQAARAEQI